MCVGLKPYVCSVCDYAGRSRSNLKTHMNRHNTERRHLCDLCGKKFKSKVTLKSHRLSHTDEGTYTLLCHWWWCFLLSHCFHCKFTGYLFICQFIMIYFIVDYVLCVASILLDLQKFEEVQSDDKKIRAIILFFQGSGFSVRSVTSPRCLNLPCSDIWSNTLNLRSEYTHKQTHTHLIASVHRTTIILYYISINGKISVGGNCLKS